MSVERVTVPDIRSRKRRSGSRPIVMVTAYDAPGARIVDAAGVDIVLVGDSVADNVLGYPDTLHVTVDDMVRHVAAVARAGPRALIVADMPWMSYHLGPEEAVRNAAALVRAGAEAVKLEGGEVRLPVISALLRAEIPVMGHLGLTPQSVHAMGGYRVQARTGEAARSLVAAAAALAEAGCFALVLEGVPDVVAEAATGTVDVPTIGIGAGPSCDGQVLVFHDLLGLGRRPAPRFARAYLDMGGLATEAIARFAADVRDGRFPSAEESYHGPPDLRDALGPNPEPPRPPEPP
ncbi:MAG TPA: 3-methyl-2-oxobutanoate hydroxymethyltransferase [Acidimicrobiales bacterium]|nr:3-methyl-2-oxobutanoate hydroxymethyltransferase [Acidimicrobiales bacterium]